MLNTRIAPWPSFTQEEADAVSRVLLSNRVNYWTGEEGRLFEREFAAYVGTEYAVACANGTVALDLAFIALGVGPGDEVIVTSRTFLASVSSIVNTGAKPVFADVDLDSQNILVGSIESLVNENTKVILCVHLAGWPCDMDPIMEMAHKHDLFVVEDCAQAHGATYKGRKVGAIGDIGCWSFCQDKIMSTGGEGGMVTTNSKDYWSTMWSYKDHGKSWEAVYEREHPTGFRWVHESFGTNWRMTEIQAVIGRIQLGRLESWHNKRLKYARQIWNAARLNPLFRVPELRCENCECTSNLVPTCEHAAYKCYVFAKEPDLRDEIISELNRLGVPCYSGSCSEVYLERAFEGTPFRPAEPLMNAKLLGQTSLMFLCHPTIEEEDMDRICETIASLSMPPVVKLG